MVIQFPCAHAYDDVGSQQDGKLGNRCKSSRSQPCTKKHLALRKDETTAERVA